MSTVDLAIIGGTGVYRLARLQDAQRHLVETPYGPPSDAVVAGTLHGRRVLFLARHGENHVLAPHEINYRGNLWALHSLGARRVLAVNSVGGISARMAPRALVVPDQLVDYTWGRAHTYAGNGNRVEHVDLSWPYDAGLRGAVLDAGRAAGLDLVDGGTYGATQGPRLETRAEIRRLAGDGCDLVGMTGMPEAALAKELGLAYACVAVVANWAAGCGDEAEITMADVLGNMEQATARLPALIDELLASF
ncbi:MAG: S-methyl-5'-thioinosine phosphorylase [Xanthomonadales bacterium]|nr:S-methyl-5'-thioinosine phosphorylase [Xanthomonadales bacterium]